MLIDHNTFLLLKTTIKKDGWLELPSFGNSMYPIIQQGNLCRFVHCQTTLLKKGDVILFYTKTGQLIAHRLVSIKIVNNQRIFQLKGDTNLGFDQLIGEDQILGKLVRVQKKHRIVTSEARLARCWGKVILSFPALSGILRRYLNSKLQF
ncbi:signal peptidase I [Neobacillus niacini]|uniref:signal peptidase I n=1 Tax=Neobacillus niacini TaxID=86668 RepID=UPI003000F703